MAVSARSVTHSIADHMSSKQPFETIVEIHGPTVLRVCRAVVGATDADDAWSETFISAMRGYPLLPADANVEAWLVTIAHRRPSTSGRARTRRAVPTDTITDRADRKRSNANRPRPCCRPRDAPRQATPIGGRTTTCAGLPYAEVAAILGGTVEAARRAAADGIATLRRSSTLATLRNEPR